MADESYLKISKSLQPLAMGLDDLLTEIAGEKVGFCLVVFKVCSD